MRVASLIGLMTLMALSACNDAKKSTGDERKTAAGEVLGGSVSDAMLPLDTVQSQSPPLRESTEGGDPKGKAGAAKSDEPAANASPSETSSAPTATPSVAPTPQAEN